VNDGTSQHFQEPTSDFLVPVTEAQAHGQSQESEYAQAADVPSWPPEGNHALWSGKASEAAGTLQEADTDHCVPVTTDYLTPVSDVTGVPLKSGTSNPASDYLTSVSDVTRVSSTSETTHPAADYLTPVSDARDMAVRRKVTHHNAAADLRAPHQATTAMGNSSFDARMPQGAAVSSSNDHAFTAQSTNIANGNTMTTQAESLINENAMTTQAESLSDKIAMTTQAESLPNENTMTTQAESLPKKTP
jgi:hypothetical protein